MARIDLNPETAPEFVARIGRIQDGSQRQWGTLSPERMLRHLRHMFEVSLGDRPAEKVFVPAPGFLLWYLFFEWFTNWPRGRIKAPPGLFPEPEGGLDAEREACLAALRRFVAALEERPGATGYSPLLGHIPLRKWARVHGVHLDHHLRQFGV
ncbi:MAG: DUF1569 domain-containing protein [Candidatus Hydrogenedentes bacterium]|nr:DUF1569 domain-containing protein [Candidatus Hydrogenedentota bacterium]